jgi:hypothetical protein
VDGREENTNPENLGWTCRSCNVKCGVTLRNAGLGRRTRQYNPVASGPRKKNPEGAENLGASMNAITSMKGEGGTMDVGDAIALIHATPASRRSAFARDVWKRRRARGDGGTVPF